jgi:hypothetical protein
VLIVCDRGLALACAKLGPPWTAVRGGRIAAICSEARPRSASGARSRARSCRSRSSAGSRGRAGRSRPAAGGPLGSESAALASRFRPGWSSPSAAPEVAALTQTEHSRPDAAVDAAALGAEGQRAHRRTGTATTPCGHTRPWRGARTSPPPRATPQRLHRSWRPSGCFARRPVARLGSRSVGSPLPACRVMRPSSSVSGLGMWIAHSCE